MGECKESSVSVQSTLRGPMILAKVITDALESKKRVRELVHEYTIAIEHAMMANMISFVCPDLCFVCRERVPTILR